MTSRATDAGAIAYFRIPSAADGLNEMARQGRA
jgi:hypothetical protein